MTRLTIVIIAAALLGVAALSVAHAQEPTGSISGRIIVEGDTGQDLRSIILSYVAVIRADAQ